MLIIPADKNKANNDLLRLAKFFQQKMKTAQTYPINKHGNQFRQSIKFDPPPLDLKSKNNHSGKIRKKSQNIK